MTETPRRDGIPGDPSGDWDPIQYLRFTDERLQPALDLLARVPLSAPANVVDLGCGPGNVTVILRQRFPKARMTGVDASPTMLEKARAALPEARFVEANFASWSPERSPEGSPEAGARPDLIYSNAALHWVGGHETLFPRLVSLLAPGGVLAVQMPGMHNAPLRQLQHTIANEGPWAGTMRGVGAAPPPLAPGEYWDLLRPIVAALDIWETTYLHVLHGEDAVGEWASGSSLRPFLDKLPPEQRPEFRRAYAEAVRPHYPRRADGTTLLAFRRLFLLART